MNVDKEKEEEEEERPWGPGDSSSLDGFILHTIIPSVFVPYCTYIHVGNNIHKKRLYVLVGWGEDKPTILPFENCGKENRGIQLKSNANFLSFSLDKNIFFFVIKLIKYFIKV